MTCGGVPAVELAEELVAAGVETDDGRVDAVECVMVAALLEFGLVVQQRGIGFAFDLHLAGGQVALEVGRVVHGIPQAPFHGAGHVDDGRSSVVFVTSSRLISALVCSGTKAVSLDSMPRLEASNTV